VIPPGRRVDETLDRRHGGTVPPVPKRDDIPDVRDGLTRKERVVLWQIRVLEEELGRPSVPTAMLYGRVVEHVDMSVDELQRILQRLTGRSLPGPPRRTRGAKKKVDDE
jgi:hypothetical protein